MDSWRPTRDWRSERAEGWHLILASYWQVARTQRKMAAWFPSFSERVFLKHVQKLQSQGPEIIVWTETINNVSIRCWLPAIRTSPEPKTLRFIYSSKAQPQLISFVFLASIISTTVKIRLTLQKCLFLPPESWDFIKTSEIIKRKPT